MKGSKEMLYLGSQVWKGTAACIPKANVQATNKTQARGQDVRSGEGEFAFRITIWREKPKYMSRAQSHADKRNDLWAKTDSLIVPICLHIYLIQA